MADTNTAKGTMIDPAFSKTTDLEGEAGGIARVKAAYEAIEPLCHPMTLIVPRASYIELDAIVEGIKLHGYDPSEAILVDGPQILDGRTRSVAMYLIHGDKWWTLIPHRQATREERADVLTVVLRKNFARRNLDPDARALVAARMLVGEIPCEIPGDAPEGGRLREKIANLCSVKERSVESAKKGLQLLRYQEVNRPKDPALAKEVDDLRYAVLHSEVAPNALKIRADSLKTGKVHQPARRVQSNTETTVDGAKANPYADIPGMTPEVAADRMQKISQAMRKALEGVEPDKRKGFLTLIAKFAIQDAIRNADLLDATAKATKLDADAAKAKAAVEAAAKAAAAPAKSRKAKAA